ncbi:hypothetical protein C5167_051187, partial [Papaver somniferum]
MDLHLLISTSGGGEIDRMKRFGLEEEIDRMKRDHSVLMSEVVRLQVRNLGFLVKALKNSDFVHELLSQYDEKNKELGHGIGTGNRRRSDS